MRHVTRVAVERIARCPFSIAHEYAEDYLRDAERAVTIRVPVRDALRALSGKGRKPVQLVFALHPDETESGRGHDAMLVEWRAGTRLFPDFHGTLRLRIATVDTTRLTFEGAYRPPLGRSGIIFDVLIGRFIARAAMAGLLRRIVEALEYREAEYRARFGPSGIVI